MGVACLGGSQSDQRVDGLLSQLGTTNNASSKEKLLELGVGAVPGLRKTAMVGTRAARVEAIQLLAKVGSDRDYELLVDLLTDTDQAVQRPASDAIDDINRREMVALDAWANRPDSRKDLEKEGRDYDDRWEPINGGAEGSRIREVLDLGDLRVGILNYLKSSTPQRAGALLRDMVQGSREDRPMNLDSEPELMTCGMGVITYGFDKALRALLDRSPELVTSAFTNRNNRYRSALLDLTSKNPPASLRSLFVKLATDTVDFVRYGACKCLHAFHDEEVQRTLIDLTRDKYGQIRYQALESLGEMNPPLTLDLAVELSSDKVIGQAIHFCLVSSIREAKCLPRLVELLDSKDRELACSACVSICSIRDPQAVNVLSRIVHTGQDDLREEVATALQFRVPELAAPLLIDCLDDRDDRVVANACESLKELNDVRALGKLKMLCHSANANVRESARSAVDALTAKESLPPP